MTNHRSCPALLDYCSLPVLGPCNANDQLPHHPLLPCPAQLLLPVLGHCGTNDHYRTTSPPARPTSIIARSPSWGLATPMTNHLPSYPAQIDCCLLHHVTFTAPPPPCVCYFILYLFTLIPICIGYMVRKKERQAGKNKRKQEKGRDR